MNLIRVFDNVACGQTRRIMLTVALLALAAGTCLAQGAEDLRITVGKSIVIDYPGDIRQISTSNPEIVDASPVTTREILMSGKGLGSATMVVWSKSDQRMFYNVTVELNLEPLRRILQDTYPNEKIDIHSSRDSLTLNGTVSSKDIADRAAALSSTFAKTVVNNLVIPSPIEKQILLRVKFAELDRTKALQYGVNFLSKGALNTVGAISTGQFGSATVNPTTVTSQAGVTNSAGTITVSDALNFFAFRPDLNIAAFVRALQDDNILQILAEPNLVTTNGKEANFIVGGEFPVPVLQGGGNSGAVTIQFREFGIRLLFTPQMTTNKTIKLALRQEVSTLDFANAVTLQGFLIPALSTRRAETNVELAEGQTFVVAGLMDNRETSAMSQIPIISSIPVLGQLFKSKVERKNSTELVMLVTPEVTEPLGPNDPKPTPYFPKDFLKRLEPKDVQPAKSVRKN
ncbi:MAG TPA: pilus assembly protein N-terminal domain-containing protein [Bryobacteraceae bacterium]|nr:pilus assembly protein N-terminal domain-containing protein [Bryobacteraceae bacterium]